MLLRLAAVTLKAAAPPTDIASLASLGPGPNMTVPVPALNLPVSARLAPTTGVWIVNVEFVVEILAVAVDRLNRPSEVIETPCAPVMLACTVVLPLEPVAVVRET